MVKKALAITAMILLVLGYPIILAFLLARVDSAGEIYRVLFMLVYALLYLLCWMLLLLAGIKRNSKPLQTLYQVFWLITTAYLVITPQISPVSVLDGIAVIGWFIFVAPLVGLDGLVFHMAGSYSHSSMLYVAFAVSLIMFLFGFLVKRKRIGG